MNTIQCWITRDSEYAMHFEQPTLSEDDNGKFWDSEINTPLIPSDSYALNPGGCMEWVMVKKEDFEELQAKVKELQSIQTIKNSRPKGISA